MATWHQLHAVPVRLWHPTQWTVVIDPPNRMRFLVCFTTREGADVYMRGLKDNDLGAHAHSYILPPGGK